MHGMIGSNECGSATEIPHDGHKQLYFIRRIYQKKKKKKIEDVGKQLHHTNF